MMRSKVLSVYNSHGGNLWYVNNLVTWWSKVLPDTGAAAEWKLFVRDGEAYVSERHSRRTVWVDDLFGDCRVYTDDVGQVWCPGLGNHWFNHDITNQEREVCIDILLVVGLTHFT